MTVTACPAEIIGVIGLGYVGLPLAVAFAQGGFDVTGFDIDRRRVEALCRGQDRTGEVGPDELHGSGLKLTADPDALRNITFYIIAVPTPIDENRCPDLRALRGACELVGRTLRRGDVVVVESTVYPGTTEEVCVAVLESVSGLACGTDFHVGYSPERINPGDRDHRFEQVVKVVSGQDAPTLDRIAAAYGSVVPAGIHRAPSIKVAEAAKVIENTQRDVNIALMNEIAKICHLVGIRTQDVLRAAGTKWNFLKFQPGLVGGHCIGVDPYYLTAKAESLGYHPEVILSGRRINDSMGDYVALQVIRHLARTDRSIAQARVGVLGLTFKENVPDIRNSATFDIIRTLTHFGMHPIVHDPLADPEEVRETHQLSYSTLDAFAELDVLILAVPHRAYVALGGHRIGEMIAETGVFVDVRSGLGPEQLRRDIHYWAL